MCYNTFIQIFENKENIDFLDEDVINKSDNYALLNTLITIDNFRK